MSLLSMLQNIVLGGAFVIVLASLYEYTSQRLSH